MVDTVAANRIPADKAPRFSAEIPWIGPIVGAPDDARLPLAGAVDPARMEAFGAAFIPVVQQGELFEPADPNGNPTNRLKAVAWVQPAKRDVYGWFRISAPVGRWRGKFDGVLVVLLYNESQVLGYRTFEEVFPDATEIVLAGEAVEIDEERAKLKSAGAAGAKGVDIPSHDDVVAGIAYALRDLLRHTKADELRSALSEVRFWTVRGKLTFALASCQYPTGLLEEVVATASYGRLAAILDGKRDGPRPRALLLAGDQVYVDGTAGLFDPTAGFDRYVRPYEILYRLAPVRHVVRRLPTYMLLDDHEIVDNWEPRCDDVRPDPIMLEGRRSYMNFERAAGPPPEAPVGDSTDPMWYRFTQDGFGFFMADTRTERTARAVGHVDTARIMSEAQFASLLEWLGKQPPDQPKFVVTPSILLPRHRRACRDEANEGALRSDGWDGYPGSLHALLAFIAANRLRYVVFLSGDEHLSCVARATIVPCGGGEPTVVHSVHGSPLFAPFPFANSVREDLAATDTFPFGAWVTGHGPLQFECTVNTTFASPGDGFALLRVFRQCRAGPWWLSCRFNRDPAVAPPARPLRYRL